MTIKLTTKEGNVFIKNDDIDAYRGTSISPYNCVIYLLNGDEIYVYETFAQVDSLFTKN